jgi:PAS domain S-box-containing protein
MGMSGERHGSAVARQVRRSDAGGEDLVRELFELAPSFLAVGRGPDHIFEMVNPAYERLVGMSAAELVGRSVREALPEVVEIGLVDRLDEVYRTGEPFIGVEVELPPLIRDGEAPRRRVVSFVYQAVHDRDGRITGLAAHGVDVTEQVIAREKLEARERRFRSLIENASDTISVLDADGVLRYSSPSGTRLLGWEASEVLGQPAASLTHPDDVAALTRAMSELISNTGDPARLQYRLRHRDGSWRWFETTATGIDGPDGRREIIANSRDVTQERAAHAAILDGEARLRTLADLIPQLVWTTRPDGYHDYYNERWYAYTGMARGSDDGWAFEPVLHPDDRAAALTLWRRSLETGEPYEIEYRLRRADGEYRWFIGRALPMHDDDGAVLRWFGTCTDVHDEKQAMEALRASEERSAAIASATNDVVYDYDIERGTLWWSDAVQRLLALEPEAMAADLDSWAQRVYHEDRERVTDSLAAALAGSETVWSNEYRFVCGDGRVAHVLDRGLIMRAAHSGRPLRMVGTMSDLSERRTLEDALHHAQKMEAVGRLAGGIAHDFNNLLTVMSGTVELMLQDMPAGGPLRTDADVLRETTLRAAALTRQLLAFSRRQVLKAQVIDLNEVVASTFDMLRRLIGEDIRLVSQPATALRPVRADPDQMSQVIINLAVNARDAMPAGGTLTLSTHNVRVSPAEASRMPELSAGDYVVLTVSDTGIGMDAATLARVFEPFFTTKGDAAGTGLGMATAYGIVSQSGGHIVAASEPGSGSRFRIYLPTAAESVPAADKPELATRAGSGGATVLLVEDEDGVRNLIRRVLTKKGYAIVEAVDGVDGMVQHATHADAIDLILTDLVMPRLGGRHMVERLRDAGYTGAVLYMSGYTEDEIFRRQACEPGTGFMEKPFTIDVLLEQVAKALQCASVSEGVNHLPGPAVDIDVDDA